ncbi:MAG TPA: hypothetical protein VNO26_13380 [Candidatus Limnocylindria bacterium]|nr:hypothetical protein [Candidatus Limnocylindria bacterium]
MGTEYVPSDLPGFWRQDPASLLPIAMGATWGHVVPFVIPSGEPFRVPPPTEPLGVRQGRGHRAGRAIADYVFLHAFAPRRGH